MEQQIYQGQLALRVPCTISKP